MGVSLKDSAEVRAEAARIVQRGGVIAFRTDTFYGLGADPLNALAVQQIKKLKGREDNKPILLLISDVDQLERFIVEKTDAFDEIANEFWPGQITLIGRARAELPHDLTAGTDSIGLRFPDDESVRSLVRECGGALTATSANPSGESPACNAADVERYFPNGLDLIIDGGEVSATLASTVLDLSGAQPHLVREGAVTRKQLLGFISLD